MTPNEKTETIETEASIKRLVRLLELGSSKLAREDFGHGSMLETFRLQVRYELGRRGMNQKELAEVMKTTTSRLSYILRQATTVRVDTLLKVAKALDCCLKVSLIPFSELIDPPKSWAVRSFVEEFKDLTPESQGGSLESGCYKSFLADHKAAITFIIASRTPTASDSSRTGTA